MKNPKIFVVIPAYNEETMIGDVVKNVAKYCNKIIVVDDGSADKTASRARHTKSIVLRHVVNLGQGAALQTGLEYAKKDSADIVVTYDADGQLEPKDIDKVVTPILRKRADAVLGSRFLGTTIGIPVTRLMLLKAAILFTRVFSGVKLTDTHNGLRALNKKAFNTIIITQNGMAHASEIIDQIAIQGLRYEEVPVTVRYNRYSLSKGQRSANSVRIFVDLLFRKLT